MLPGWQGADVAWFKMVAAQEYTDVRSTLMNDVATNELAAFESLEGLC
jgi:hypothetical protein